MKVFATILLALNVLVAGANNGESYERERSVGDPDATSIVIMLPIRV